MVKVTIDPKKCIMCNLCIDMVSEVFEEKEGKCVAKISANLRNKEILSNAKMAEESCPVQAIMIK